jgi:ribose/xylose/arabinose/galactoside ABC-type transport system permease subunit
MSTTTSTGPRVRGELLERIARIWATNRWALPTVAAFVIFVGMLGYGEVTYGRILQYNTISNLLINNAHLVLIAVGMTFVILQGEIDLSVGAVIAFSSVSGVMLVGAGWNPWVVMVLMVATGAGFGAVSGTLVQYFNVQPFIATLATMFLARGLASMLSTVPERLPADSDLRLVHHNFELIDGERVNDLVVTPGVIIAALVVVAAVFVLYRTRFGRTVYAIGGSEQSALLMGLPVARTRVLVYVISGSLAGLAAVVYTSRLGSAQNITGVGWELDAIAATVIGGTLLTGGSGSVIGSVVGALVIGLMTVLITRDGSIPPEATTIITGGILLVFVLLQRGLIGRKRE